MSKSMYSFHINNCCWASKLSSIEILILTRVSDNNEHKNIKMYYFRFSKILKKFTKICITNWKCINNFTIKNLMSDII